MADTVRTTTSIDEVLQNAVSRGDVPGVVAMAANEDGPIYEGAAGVRSVARCVCSPTRIPSTGAAD